MKAALITEEQIKAIEDALDDARTFIRNGVSLGFIRLPDLGCPDPANNTYEHIQQALAIVQSLKVQEPIAMIRDAYDCNGLDWFCDAPPGILSMLYAGEQP